ncbi:MAG: hypothetical protein H6901_03825 [Rhodobacteraceae bacterium]|nr:hypothetical protein [Paracoccaceae bacterium]MCP5341323.1 hypothetical protein [Paracoccaceae bacterium]
MKAASARERPAGRKRRSGRGALFLVAVLLGLSGALRLGAGAGEALANAQRHAATDEATLPEACTPEPGTMAMLAALRDREERLAGREAMIADQAQALALAKTEIDQKLAALTDAEEKLAATLAQTDHAADKDVARLVAVYERMKPKDAAPLFEEMAPEFAAGFLARMRPEAAAAVMAGLAPPRAYAISVLLAGRNAKAPKE